MAGYEKCKSHSRKKKNECPSNLPLTACFNGSLSTDYTSVSRVFSCLNTCLFLTKIHTHTIVILNNLSINHNIPYTLFINHF